jgi:hypothetical protein
MTIFVSFCFSLSKKPVGFTKKEAFDQGTLTEEEGSLYN